MCRFIMQEIIDFEGKYCDDTSKLAQPQYRDLVDFARLELNKDDYQRILGTYELKTLMYIYMYAMFDVYTCVDDYGRMKEILFLSCMEI